MARLRERVLSGFPEDEDVGELVAPLAELLAGETFVVADLRRVGLPLVHVAEGFEALTGYPSDVALGRDLGFLLHNDTDQDAVREAREAVRDGQAMVVTLRNYRADGSLFWCEQRHHPLRDGRSRVSHLVTVLRDVTEQVNARSAEAAARELVSALSGESAWFAYGALVDARGRCQVTWASEACRSVLGVPSTDLLGDGLLERLAEEDKDAMRERWEALRSGGGSSRERYRLLGHDGRLRQVEDFTAVSWAAPEAGVVALHGVIGLVSERGDDLRLGGVDASTGLPTNEVAEDRVQQAVRHARRHGKRAAVVALELDHFDFVHHHMDAERGERLVREAARRLQRALRRADTLARVGPASFLVVLDDLASPEAALPVVEKLLAWVARPFDDGSLRVELSASAGIALGGPHTRSAQLRGEAETALRQAKADGGGRFSFHDTGVGELARERRAFESELHAAFTDDRFVLHYQPRVRLSTGEVTSVEALVRWQHPERGLLLPGEFLPALEQARLSDALFEQVLSRAAEQATAWRRAGQPRRVAVNVNPAVLERDDLVRCVRRTLTRFDLHPALIEIEIHEGTGTRVLERVTDQLRELRGLGVRLSLDDFGVADINLSLLRELPLDALKIDQSFIARVGEGAVSADLEMLRAIVSLGRGLGLTVVAEGVETQAQRRRLQAFACEEAQGFLFAEARPAAEALSYGRV